MHAFDMLLKDMGVYILAKIIMIKTKHNNGDILLNSHW